MALAQAKIKDKNTVCSLLAPNERDKTRNHVYYSSREQVCGSIQCKILSMGGLSTDGTE